MTQEVRIVHDSHSLLHRDPFGAVPTEEAITLRLSIIPASIVKRVWARVWEEGKGETKLEMQPVSKKLEANLYEVGIHAPDIPGWLWYYFIIETDKEILLYGNNEEGLGGAGKLYLGQEPPAFQITVFRAGVTTPEWFKHAVIYQIMVDRFYNGEERILAPKPGCVLHADWSNTPFYIRDPDTNRVLYYDFFGGNLRGVMEKLPYLQELGVNVIYLNPIFESPSNHRYDTGDYHKVDSMLGDNALFAKFCDIAGRMGIAVILDGVFSHTGSDSIYFNREGRYPTIGAYQSIESPYYHWYRFSHFPDKYECWWGIDSLPNVDETQPSYLDFVIDGEESVLKYWMRQGVKGWRLDVADELPDMFIKRFRKVLKTLDNEAVLIGEVWEDASHKFSSNAMREYLGGEELDAVMNYPFRQVMLDFLLGRIDADVVERYLWSVYENYPLQVFYSLMNLIGSHDVPRVLTILGEAPETLSVGKQARYRLAGEQERLGIDRLKLLVLWQMTFPGVPSIYYGDEAGVQGYKDPFNRGSFPWGKENLELLAWYKKLVSLRRRHDALRTGEWRMLKTNSDVYSCLRNIKGGKDVFGSDKQDGTFLIIFNRSRTKIRTVTLEVEFGLPEYMIDLLADDQEYQAEGGQISVILKPLEGKLLMGIKKPAFRRECGVLLHISCLPGGHGIGDLGASARKCIDFLHNSGQKLWQFLPLNPVGPVGSPYYSTSAFAGNPLLVSLDQLVADGLLLEGEVETDLPLNNDVVRFTEVHAYKERLLRYAFARFQSQGNCMEYEQFQQENGAWLFDYSLFEAIRKKLGGLWYHWPSDIAQRKKAAIIHSRQLLREEIAFHEFCQYCFFRQMKELKTYAEQREIQLVGDLPIYVCPDSADVWANQQLFELDAQGRPAKVAGVPPDYFSNSGQLWGNPLYRWPIMASDHFAWWRLRFAVLLQQVHRIRLDHFRGFAQYWEVPAGADTAIHGRWVEGPGVEFFHAMEEAFGSLPLILEDLVAMTYEVAELKRNLAYPGMKVLQFSLLNPDAGDFFGCEKNIVLYTGTHDNDTTVGWFHRLLMEQPDQAERIAGLLELKLPQVLPECVCRRLIEKAFASSANTVIIPFQDILALGSEARMNTPGTLDGNWRWRCRTEDFTKTLQLELNQLAARYDR